MSLLPVGFGASGDYEITDSLRIRNSASASLQRFNATETNRRTFTYSGWFKLGYLNNDYWFQSARYNTSNFTGITINVNQGFGIYQKDSNNITFVVREAGEKRDYAAWYHFVAAVDTTQSTSTNRVKLYVNGVLSTSLVSASYPSQNLDTFFNTTTAVQTFAQSATTGNAQWDGYVTETHFIDGQQLTADDFGEFDANGTWKPKKYTGTHGTNGFYLPMKPTTQANGFNTVLYTGDGTSVSVNGVGFSPDFVWIKNRDDTNHHRLYDTVRGSHQMLSSSQSAAEQSKGGGLTSFDSDGFSVGNDGSENNSGDNFVAWTWDAGDNQPSTGISSVTYTGNGATQSIKGFGFSPDFVWIKNRSNAASHIQVDSVRGIGKELSSNSTGVETSNGTTRFASFDSDGFTFASTAASSLNASGNTYVAWGWDAGDGDPVSNTTGDINSTVKANDATGFSIVSYTGNGTSNSEQTIGHGLSTAPKVVIVKDRTSASTRWTFYSTDLSSDGTYAVKNLLLNSSAAESAYSSQIRGIQGSNTFSVRDVDANGNANVNKSGDNYIAYCFSEVSGVSKFSTYTGNGSTTGPVVTTGFRPGFVMTKRIDSTSHWMMFDTTRNPFNPVDDNLYANLSNAENNDLGLEVSDTGFQLKAAGGQVNVSSGTYIYMAFKGSYSDYVSPLNDTGTIDSRVKANDTYGFSIASYVGTGANATIGHGLSAAPDLAIFKNRDDGNDDWWTYNSISGATKFLRLNTTAAIGTSSVTFNDTEPTSTVFSIGTGSAINTNGDNHIAYFFRSVAGYSKIGSYQNNNSTSGVTVTTGFRPGFIILKCTDAGERWFILDNARQVNNVSPPSTAWLVPNDNAAEGANGATTATIDFLDTGFQIKTTDPATGEVSFGTRTYVYMAFADTADARFNFDASGNKNNWTPNNINSNAESESTYDLMKDTPSLVDENAANFATFNPLAKTSSASTSNANLTGTTNTSTTEMILSTVGVSSGKWYWEVTPTSITSGGCMIGIRSTAAGVLANNFVSSTDGFGYYTTGNKYSPGASASYGASYTTNDVIGLALDMDAGTLTFYKNNASQGTAFTSISGTYTPGISNGGETSGCTVQINFGQRPLAYTPPTGFLKLNTFNLPDSTIEDGSDYFAPVIYTGNGSNQDITTEHASDFVWIKSRSSTTSHGLYDNVRGTNKPLNSNNTNAEADYGAYGVDAFLSTGFGVTDIASSGYGVNENTVSYVAWSWKANGSGSSNTDGSVTSTVSANTTAGFSIVGFTAPSGTGNFTAGHGLGVTPAMVIVKTRDSGSAPWYTWSNTFSNLTDDYMRLNATNAKQTQTDGWGAGMTSSVIGLKAGSTTVATENHIAYCFAAVEGYSSFGSYTGNGSTDGPFVYTGFRPAFIITKNTSGTGGWHMTDTTRFAFNSSSQMGYLDADTTAADVTARIYNSFSNGFQIRDNGSVVNTSGSTYIYMAFAENPFKNANAR